MREISIVLLSVLAAAVVMFILGAFFTFDVHALSIAAVGR